MNDNNTTQTTEFVWRRLAEPIHWGQTEINPYLWLAVLIPVLLIGFVYVAAMYRRDGQAVGWFWAVLLGLFRCTVYAFLAIVFLLPGFQHWEETRSQSRVVLMLDVSQSQTETRDGTPSEGVPVEKLPTRQDEVLRLLAGPDSTFLSSLEKTNPIFAYRFGRVPDEAFQVFAGGNHWTRQQWDELARIKNDKEKNKDKADETAMRAEPALPWQEEQWRAWLKPDFKAAIPDDLNDEEREARQKLLEQLQRLCTGTNLGDSVLTVLNREANNMVQGIVVFSDGRSTEGSAQTVRELADRAQRAKVPIFVVAVGEDRPQVRIDITDLRVPEQARPDDRFKVIAEVTGEGLADRDWPVDLDVFAPNVKDKVATLKPKGPVKFKPGEPPHATAEFEIDASVVPGTMAPDDKGKGAKKPEFAEGEWNFQARVPKDRREVFIPQEHVSDKAKMLVVKRPLRVLLFAGGPMRDYQFLRTLLVREMEKKRVEVSIYLQPPQGQEQARSSIVQDVPPERLLGHFPNLLMDESAVNAEQKLYNLAGYDLIVAFDPDWSRLSPEELTKVERWVGTHGGGLIAVGGPVNTLQLARPGANREKVKPILDVYPVVLQDSRIQEIDRTATDPFRLNFPGATPEMEFLKLDEEHPDLPQLAGWEEFFTGSAKGLGAKTLVRGFYNYYPVEKAKDGATVIATFTDPRARLADGKDQPWIATMPYGSGKVVWLSSGELWRLRECANGESFLERFWTKLCRYTGSGNANKLNRRVLLNMGKVFQANRYVTIEAQIFGRDLKPLPEDTREKPQVIIHPPAGANEKERTIDLAPKPSQGEWGGWFTARFLVKAAGEYNVDLKVPDTGDAVQGKFLVKDANPELDNTRPDFNALYWLASDATEVLSRVPETTQKQLKAALTADRPHLEQTDQPAPPDNSPGKEKDVPRLYFTLQNANLIPQCMITASKEQRSRGAIVDLWDKGPTVDLRWVNWILLAVNGFLALVTLIVLALTVVALVRGKSASVAFYLLFTGLLLLALVPLQIFLVQMQQPVMFAVVLVVVVMLLAIEWLTRKLLRLA
jgi:hypothetical protein